MTSHLRVRGPRYDCDERYRFLNSSRAPPWMLGSDCRQHERGTPRGKNVAAPTLSS